MTRAMRLLLLAPVMLAASAPLRPQPDTLDSALQRARAERASAEAETQRLEQIADNARSDAARLQAQQAAAVMAIEAAEARITAADANLRLVSAAAERGRAELARQQRPIASLLSGLVMMARRPPLLAVADQGSTDELVKVRVLLDSTLPVIRRRTAVLSRQLAEGRQLQAAAIAAKAELLHSRKGLVTTRERFASLEAEALKASATAQGRALASGDIALAAGENVETLTAAEAGSLAARAVASELATSDPAPPRPVTAEGTSGAAPLAYILPAQAAVTQGLGSVNRNGVRSRGIALATRRGAQLIVPASGIVRFSGPFGSHDGIVIIDHGRGWLSLIVNVASPARAGNRVRLGDPLGRALGAIEVQLSQNGQRVSPALIAGSQSLSNRGKRG